MGKPERRLLRSFWVDPKKRRKAGTVMIALLLLTGIAVVVGHGKQGAMPQGFRSMVGVVGVQGGSENIYDDEGPPAEVVQRIDDDVAAPAYGQAEVGVEMDGEEEEDPEGAPDGSIHDEEGWAGDAHPGSSEGAPAERPAADFSMYEQHESPGNADPGSSDGAPAEPPAADSSMDAQDGSSGNADSGAAEEGAHAPPAPDNIPGGQGQRGQGAGGNAGQPVKLLHRRAPGPCQVEVYGGQVQEGYGRWAICSNWLNGNTIVYSFGIGGDASFDVEVVDKHGSTVHCFDPTISNEEFAEDVRAAKPNNDWGKEHLLHFHQIGLAEVDGTLKFYKKGVQGSAISVEGMQGYGNMVAEAPVKSLESIMSELGHHYVDVIKVDVEGSEYRTFSKEFTPWLLRMHPQQIMLEFHNRMFSDGGRRQLDTMQTLSSYGYKLAWQSGNKWETLFIKEHRPGSREP